MSKTNEMTCLAERFANGRISAKRRYFYNGDTIIDGWLPTVAGEVVCCGGENATPKHGFGTAEQALSAANRFRSISRDWLHRHKEPDQ